MNLEGLAVELRPRKPWEAVDLGATFLRAWGRPIYAAWLSAFLPAAILALAAFGGWGLLLLWWLKPLFDRVALFVLARAVFGDAPRLRESLRAMPRLLSGRLLDALLLTRLDVGRSFHLPIPQLEGLHGTERRRRAQVLNDETIEVAGGLTFVSLILEGGGAVALFALAPVLTPDWAGIDWGHSLELWWEGAGAGWLGLLLLACPVLSFALLEPLYVASGFALYLNRRTHLEGWDLEIAFRRLAARLRRADEARQAVDRRARTRRAAGPPALLLMSLLALFTTSPAAQAQDTAPEPEIADSEPATSEEAGPTRPWHGAPERDPRQLARQVLASPDFARESEEQRWRLRDDIFGDRDAREPPSLEGLGAVLARLGKLLLIGLVLTFLAWLIHAGLRSPGWIARRSPARTDLPPRVVAGLDISPESLPEDPASEAEAAWRAGRHADALSLLYRASLATLVTRDGVPLKESDTEDDCLEAARLKVSTIHCDYLRLLTRGWLSTAYAHRPPTDETALPLFREWQRHFGGAA